MCKAAKVRSEEAFFLCLRTSGGKDGAPAAGKPKIDPKQKIKKDQSSYVSGLLRGAGQKPSGDLWPYVRDLGLNLLQTVEAKLRPEI